MLGVKEGHTIFCDESCGVAHHEVLIKLLLCKRNDMKTFENFKTCVQNMVAQGWDINSEIPDNLEHFRFPLVHWAAVYGKLSVLKWLKEAKFDVAVTNTSGENALHRLIACQAHERAVDPRAIKTNGGRRYSLANIVQVFTKVVSILTDARPQMLLWYDYVERNTPLQLCLKLLNESESTRLLLYHETVFKVLCERLANLVKKEKLSADYVRSALARKDKSGNTLWHIVAKSRSTDVMDAVSLLINSVKDMNLSGMNSMGDTPCMVALANSFTQFASLIEEHKMPMLVVPMVKIEACPEIYQCHCENKGNTENQEDMSLHFHDFLDRSDSSQVESSPVVNGSRLHSFSTTEEESFIEPPKTFAAMDQPKVVLTNIERHVAHNNSLEKEVLQQPCSMTNSLACGNTSECNLEVLVDCDHNKNCTINVLSDSSSQEEIVIEKQIDLIVNVTQSPDISQNSVNNVMGVVADSEILPYTETHREATDENTAEVTSSLKDGSGCKNTSHCDSDSCSEVLQLESLPNNVCVPSPPEHRTSSYQTGVISDIHTPISAEGSVSKVGVNLTPVLLIKLLSEPDVSVRFQSLLKDVITGDAEKVDSTKSTLEQLGSSRVKLDSEITKGEKSLQDITTKKACLNEEISKLQLELDVLENIEENSKLKISQFKKERDNVSHKMKECESTCNRLKRRLSDCAGALSGLSPKQQKRF